MTMEIPLGLRVVRGSDWTWGDQDGGEGCVGTVAEAHTDETTDDRAADRAATARTVTVQWDCGNRCRYRCGMGGKYDLRILDSAPTGLTHPNVGCDGCGQGIEVMGGMRWKCAKCFDFDLCTPCYMEGKHSLEHAFIRFDTRSMKTRVSPRETAEQLESKGIFPGAEVVKGRDWCMEGSLDEQGKVTSVQEWSEENCSGQLCRSAVNVEWGPDHQDTCRIGYKGKVDLKCITPSSGGMYYPNHLQLVGEPPLPIDPQEFVVGDYVRVELDSDIFRLMQEGHGGWNIFMNEIRGKVGVVHHVLDSGDLSVQYRIKQWIINPDAAIKVDIPCYAADDVVRVLDDMAEVRKLQQEHDNWNEEMSAIVGQVGTVRGVQNSGDVVVIVKGQLCELNPLCLALAPDAKPPEVPSFEDGIAEAVGIRQRMLTLREEENSEFLLYAAVLGDVSAITEYLQKYPNEVNAKFNGMAAIHKAAIAGKIPVLKALVELGADVELEDGFGQRALHHCAARNQAEAAKFLLGVDADANAKTDSNKATPVIIAVAKGNKKVFDVLVSHPTVDLTAQDSDGDTALHYAVLKRKHLSVTALLDAGADPTLINFKLSTPLQLAAEKGFLPALEDCIKRFPQLVNQKNDDSLTLLHIAALNNHKDIAIFLLKQTSCDIDALTQDSHTPLHLAVLKGHTRIVELLVGYGASLNVADSDGDTPLHTLFMDTEMVAPSSETPEIKRVQESLEEHVGSSTSCVVACFLVREGADIHIKNKNDNPPLQLFPPDVREVVSNFMERNGRCKLFHGSLCASSSKNTVSDTQQSTETQDESTSPPVAGQSTTAQESDVTSGITQPVADNDISPSNLPFTSQHTTKNGGQMPTLDGLTASNTDPPQNIVPTFQATTGAADNPDDQLCLLCDNPITVKFEPCGHAVLCEICSERARKCPECKSQVRNVRSLTSL